MDQPFIEGQASRGRILNPGYEHLTFEIQVVRLRARNTLLVHTGTPTRSIPRWTIRRRRRRWWSSVCKKSATGTLLTLTESGFDKIPAHRRDEALRMNTGGWDAADEEHRAACRILARLSRSARSYAPVFAALGDPTRLSLIAKLARGVPCSISAAHRGHQTHAPGRDQAFAGARAARVWCAAGARDARAASRSIPSRSTPRAAISRWSRGNGTTHSIGCATLWSVSAVDHVRRERRMIRQRRAERPQQKKHQRQIDRELDDGEADQIAGRVRVCRGSAASRMD